MEALPEYLRYTSFGQKVQQTLNSSKANPLWLKSALIYRPDTPLEMDESDCGETYPLSSTFPIGQPHRIWIGSNNLINDPILPTYWSLDDLHDQLVSRHGSIHINSDITENREIRLRANNSVPIICGTYYFEVTIDELSNSRQPFMIGVSSEYTNPGRPIIVVGTQGQCWLYFSDDGRIMSDSGSARKFGPKFGPGDTIGCGIDYSTRSIFYTKNGASLGQAFCDVSSSRLYPFLNVHAGAIFSTNFGANDFKYDIVRYVMNRKKLLFDVIDSTPLRAVGSESNDEGVLLQLVTDYLGNMGYYKSAKAMAVEFDSRDGDAADDTDETLLRQKLRQHIMDAEIGEAIALVREHFPSAFEDDPGLLFELNCQRMAAAICNDDLEQAFSIGQSLKHECDTDTAPNQENLAKLKLVCGMLAYPRDAGGAPYEEEHFGLQARAEIMTRITAAIVQGEGLKGHLPSLISSAIKSLERKVEHDPKATHLNIYQDIL